MAMTQDQCQKAGGTVDTTAPADSTGTTSGTGN
jgi:hypothetical protein